MQSIAEIFGKNVRRLRQERNLTQSTLASQAGLSLTFLQNIEAGRRWVGTESIAELARCLEVSECDLFQPPAAAGSKASRAKAAPPGARAKARTPHPEPKEVLVLIGRALGYDVPDSLLKTLKRKRRAPGGN